MDTDVHDVVDDDDAAGVSQLDGPVEVFGEICAIGVDEPAQVDGQGLTQAASAFADAPRPPG